MERIIALLTDFGPRGQHYVAAMKGVILKINPLANIIDISHKISPFSVIEASYILKTTYIHFPKNTVFITVVDPGVGSARELIALKTNSDYYFIGPNNGIFPNVFDKSEISECVNIQNEDYFNHPVSSTFHGRDIMAPIGAYITKFENFPLSELGSNFKFNNLIKFPLVYEINLEENSIKSTIQYVDSFGNGTTSIPMAGNKIMNTDLNLEDDSKISFTIKEKNYEAIFTSHFASMPIDSLLFIIGSTGYLEISINQGNASKILNFKAGDIITINIEERKI
ncbi:MAG: SAM-dependent chlorinase/fluorinase [Promethearchaeota archaeon]|nr:MAG: SAM-dependent chlorinase/fluorinase [Candidatus Lokiarchaeota archaeon]